jgi:hypothetical protein
MAIFVQLLPIDDPVNGSLRIGSQRKDDRLQ